MIGVASPRARVQLLSVAQLEEASQSSVLSDESFAAAATAGSWDAAASGDQFATAATVGRKDAATSDFGLKHNPRKAITYSRRSAPNV